jgi:probable rRNA maturation factor
MENQKILISNKQNLKKLPKDRINKKIAQILNALEYDDHEISILFTDDIGIEKLNNSFRGIQKPTNVLSFPMLDSPDYDKEDNNENKIILPETNLLGDVVISVETAAKEAEQAKITLEQRISQLLIHGILHLIGYDHEKGEEHFLKMEQKSLDLIKLIEDDTNLYAF